ncbi:hypothetical protein N7462_005322 [Penicillium macrosclerotiorum]|uniref:uncharacterized protein n=1 Tax=Penicillium macrosclerotiorum TaxID=303699 RepID=UPI00254984FF|nr:uncharacterized protein N7462_005322 [Penicillium macrosclerotiorum]KAJ5682157.1 hypothetical protein N7462_005322 [Penicillium macrosclerotiorum]
MGSILIHHVSDHLDSQHGPPPYPDTMLGATLNQEGYARASHDGRSRSSSANTTPTSTTAPPTVGSVRLPAHANDLPAYLNSHPPSHSSSTPSEPPFQAPPSSMTSHSNYGIPPSDHPSYSNAQTPQYPSYPQHPSSGHHPAATPAAAARADSMRSDAHPARQTLPESPRLQPTFRSMQSLGGSEANSPSRIRVQSLSHIQSLANDVFLTHRPGGPAHVSSQRQFEISSMPVTDIIEMVAGLLTKITTTNDMHHEQVHRHIPPPDGTSTLSPQASSVLAFHGKNVPSITILSYLTRIHKYCPTTYEVFLSLLVYFDRMTELVNQGPLDRSPPRSDSTPPSADASGTHTPEPPASRHPADASMVTPPSSTGMTAQDPKSPHASISPALYPQGEDENLSHFFVVDSFNIHRLVIAGVTCASKFFSDVFYTNSRYAKVGGLPLVELNHLELQFLLLNDFRLAIPVEELEAYGTMLVEFYAREVVAQQQQQQQQQQHQPQTSVPRAINSVSDSAPDAMYMRSRDKGPGRDGLGQNPTPP